MCGVGIITLNMARMPEIIAVGPHRTLPAKYID